LKNHKFKLFERFFFSSKNPKNFKVHKNKKNKKSIYEAKMWKDAKDQTKIQVVVYLKITNLNYSRDFFFPQKIQKFQSP